MAIAAMEDGSAPWLEISFATAAMGFLQACAPSSSSSVIKVADLSKRNSLLDFALSAPQPPLPGPAPPRSSSRMRLASCSLAAFTAAARSAAAPNARRRPTCPRYIACILVAAASAAVNAAAAAAAAAARLSRTHVSRATPPRYAAWIFVAAAARSIVDGGANASGSGSADRKPCEVGAMVVVTGRSASVDTPSTFPVPLVLESNPGPSQAPSAVLSSGNPTGEHPRSTVLPLPSPPVSGPSLPARFLWPAAASASAARALTNALARARFGSFDSRSTIPCSMALLAALSCRPLRSDTSSSARYQLSLSFPRVSTGAAPMRTS
mmetsp:Transcript_23787/g.58988  ORF Transcript_23787/g.58988 Transcript_23787/m.58988 type:complete len:323 (-) Transcript_23787:135-1103(-)